MCLYFLCMDSADKKMGNMWKSYEYEKPLNTSIPFPLAKHHPNIALCCGIPVWLVIHSSGKRIMPHGKAV